MDNQSYIIPDAEIKAGKKIEGVLRAQTQSKEFLIFTGCFTIMMISFVLSTITGGISEIFKGLIPAICMIVATIGLWRSRKMTDGEMLSKTIKKASAYDGYLFVVYAILTIIVLLGYIGIMVMLGVVAFEANSPMTELIGMLVKVSVICLIPLIIVGRLSTIYEQRRKYFQALSECALTGEYNLAKYKLEKAPALWSYILGAWSVLMGIGAFMSSILIKLSMSAVSGLLKSFEIEGLDNVEEILNTVSEFIAGNAASTAILGVSNLVLGGYYIFSAIWISKTDKAIRDAE